MRKSFNPLFVVFALVGVVAGALGFYFVLRNPTAGQKIINALPYVNIPSK